MRSRVLAIVTMMALAVTSGAQAAAISEICYSIEQDAQSASLPNNDTRFACPVAGNRTLAELAQQGYRIVRLTPTSGPAPSSIRQQLVVQREVRIHASGFE